MCTDHLERIIRILSTVAQLVGLLMIVGDIDQDRRLFGNPGVFPVKMFWGTLCRSKVGRWGKAVLVRLRLINGNVNTTGFSRATLTLSAGGARGVRRVTLGGATAEERLDKIEKYVKQIDEDVRNEQLAISAELKKAEKRIKEASDGELNNLKEKTTALLREAHVKPLHIVWGSVCIALVGIFFGGLAPEVASWFCSCW